MTLRRFNIGDIVIGNRSANCFIKIKEGFIGVVVDSYINFAGIEAIKIHSYYDVVPCFWVRADYFDLYKQNKINTELENEFYNLVTGE